MNLPNRRQFLTSASALTYTAFCGGVAFANGAASPAWSRASLVLKSDLSGKALFDKMKWFNEPASARQSGDQLVVTTKPKTDYWRKTFYDYVTDNGHFFHMCPLAGISHWKAAWRENTPRCTTRRA